MLLLAKVEMNLIIIVIIINLCLAFLTSARNSYGCSTTVLCGRHEAGLLVSVAEERTLNQLLAINDNASHPMHRAITDQRSLFICSTFHAKNNKMCFISKLIINKPAGSLSYASKMLFLKYYVTVLFMMGL